MEGRGRGLCAEATSVFAKAATSAAEFKQVVEEPEDEPEEGRSAGLGRRSIFLARMVQR